MRPRTSHRPPPSWTERRRRILEDLHALPIPLLYRGAWRDRRPHREASSHAGFSRVPSRSRDRTAGACIGSIPSWSWLISPPDGTHYFFHAAHVPVISYLDQDDIAIRATLDILTSFNIRESDIMIGKADYSPYFSVIDDLRVLFQNILDRQATTIVRWARLNCHTGSCCTRCMCPHPGYASDH